MRITVYWVTRNPDVIVRIRKKFNIPSYTSVNYETECEIKNEDFPLLEETERRGFIRIRNKNTRLCTDKLNTITNIVFVLTDVLETNLLEMQQQYKKEGFELRHDSKRNFNTVIAAIKRLKSDVNHCSKSTQENFGNDSDMVNAMLLTLIDRCGDDDNLAYKMYEYIKSFPSKLNLDLDLDNAFSHLFKKEKL